MLEFTVGLRFKPLYLAVFFLACACTDVAPGTEGKSGDNAGESGGVRLEDLTDDEISSACADFEPRGTVECTDAETGETRTVEDDFDSAECEDRLTDLREDVPCLRVEDMIACFRLPVCERVDCPLQCPEWEKCNDYAVDECEARSDGACRVRYGARLDAQSQCLVHAGAYCTRSVYGCDAAVSELEGPEGSCWRFSCTNEGDRPAGWSEAESTCRDALQGLDYCPGKGPPSDEETAEEIEARHAECLERDPTMCGEGCDELQVQRMDVEGQCIAEKSDIACIYRPFPACGKANNTTGLVAIRGPDGACYLSKAACLPEGWVIENSGECADLLSMIPYEACP